MTSSPLHQRLHEQLLARQHSLRAQLSARTLAPEGEAAQVHDFKDAADEESRQAVDEATSAQATQELADIAAALHRLDLGTYGTCRDCGEPIDERRLLALPATALCADCQRVHEAA